MSFVFRYSIRHPKRVVFLAFGIVTLLLPGLLHLRLRTDGHALVPAESEVVRYDRLIRDEFNLEDPIVVLIESEHANGVFNVDSVSLISNLTSELAKLDGVRPCDVVSLATEHGHRVFPGTLTFRRFLDPLPTTDKQLQTLRDDLNAIKFFTGTLVSADGSMAAIFVGTPPDWDRIELCHAIQEIIASSEPRRERLSIIGAPAAEALLGSHLLADLGVPQRLLGFELVADDQTSVQMVNSMSDCFRWVGRHVGLVPIAIAVMALVFLLTFRSLAAVALPLMEVGAAIAFVFSLMGWLGIPVYLTIAVLPVILTAIGVADEIHIFSRYRELLARAGGRDHAAVVTETMEEMWVPVTKTSVTTAVGFLSFALSPIGPVRAFGVLTAVGVIFCMFWSLTVIPAMLIWMGRSRFVPDKRIASAGATSEWPGRCGRAVMHHRYWVLAAALLVLVAAPLGVRRIVVQDSWIDGFSPSSEFYRATQRFNEGFLGAHILLLIADAGHEELLGEIEGDNHVDHRTISIPATRIDDPERLIGRHLRIEIPQQQVAAAARAGKGRGRPDRETWIEDAQLVDGRVLVTIPRTAGSPLLLMRAFDSRRLSYRITSRQFMQPDQVHRLKELATFIEGLKEHTVGGVMGTADYIETTNLIKRALNEKGRSIPNRAADIENLWSKYEGMLGVERLRQLVDEDFDRATISVYLKNANYVDTAKLMDAIRDYEEKHLNPHGITLSFAGDVAVSQTLISAIVTTQIRSLLISLVGILVVAAFLGRSLGFGVLAVLPCGMAVLINFAVMGAISMPLGVATSMFAGMTLGIGVDFAIHFLERYRMTRTRGLTVEAGITEALTVTAPAIVVDGLAVAVGFGILTMSQVPANARLGGMLVLSILGCLAATLIVLPAMLRLFGRCDADVPTSSA